MSYWVVGGHFKDTSFSKIKKGFSNEKYGPFETYEDAKKTWDYFSWKKVDDCYVRYTIIPHK